MRFFFSTLKRQLPAPDLRKVLAIKRIVAAAHITMRICPAAPDRFLAQAFANLGHAQLPFQGSTANGREWEMAEFGHAEKCDGMLTRHPKRCLIP
jgi:hypothetical protein